MAFQPIQTPGYSSEEDLKIRILKTTSTTITTRWVCFNDPAWESLCVGWVGRVADTIYLYPARWGWINIIIEPHIKNVNVLS